MRYHALEILASIELQNQYIINATKDEYVLIDEIMEDISSYSKNLSGRHMDIQIICREIIKLYDEIDRLNYCDINELLNCEEWKLMCKMAKRALQISK